MEKYKLEEKCYQVDFSKVDEGYLFSETICHAESLGKAKQKLLKEVDECKLLRSEEDITFLNIPVKRCKEFDKHEFDGASLTMFEILRVLRSRKRDNILDGILADKDINYCYIRKGSYYRPNSCGYTGVKQQAGVYTKQEAVSHAKSCKDIFVVPINIVEHNEMINKEINELKTRLL